MNIKKTIVSTAIFAFFLIAAVGSSSSNYSSSSSNRSYSSDAYSTPASKGTCYACGGRGYIMRNGAKETCVCGGSGKSTSFPDSK